MKNKYKDLSYEDGIINCLFDSCSNKLLKKRRCDALNNKNKQLIIDEAINNLSQDYKMVILKWFKSNYNLNQLAASLKVSKKTAYCLLIKGVDILYRSDLIAKLLI